MKQLSSSYERLVVKNFIVLKDIDIQIDNLNILIGPQANGKSLVAKLLAFFQSLSSVFLVGIRRGYSKPTLNKEVFEAFEERFPKYSWDNSKFEITYYVDDIYLTIESNINQNGSTSIKLKFSECLVKEYNKHKKELAPYLKQEDPDLGIGDELTQSDDYRLARARITSELKNRFPNFFLNSIFIPSSRAFFANLQKNIFTFLASNIDIDPYIKNFGRTYEQIKSLYTRSTIRNRRKSSNSRTVQSRISELTTLIMDGQYEYSKEQDWIVNDKRRVNVANASSGQQEALPMLMILSLWPFIASDKVTIFIEEPEAHLFPTAQSQVLSILSLLLSATQTKFFITTHSPYLLTGLNNLIYAKDLIESNQISNEQFEAYEKHAKPISFDQISAFQILDGISLSIKDDEVRLIGADLLDGISEHFQKTMSFLLEKDERHEF